MIRCVLPVGQGAFYFEHFKCGEFGFPNDFTIVYDCGTSSDISIIKSVSINFLSAFTETIVIDALVVSHLDDDHINGIKVLINNGFMIKRIYLPEIYDESKAFIEINHCIENEYYDEIKTGFVNLLINSESYEDAIRRYIGVSYDQFVSNNMRIIFVGEPIKRLDNNQQNNKYTLSGTNLLDGFFGREQIIKWEFVPFNFRHTDRLKKLKKELERQFGHEVSGMELSEIWKRNSGTDRYKIKEAYNRIPGTMNVNSMTMFSGVKSDNSRYCFNCLKLVNNPIVGNNFIDNTLNKCEIEKVKNGCLYTGDYEADGKRRINVLIQAYGEYIGCIDCVQIPHHGASSSFNHRLLEDIDADIYFASAGRLSRYKHPNKEVVDSVLKANKTLFVVDELEGLYLEYKPES